MALQSRAVWQREREKEKRDKRVGILKTQRSTHFLALQRFRRDANRATCNIIPEIKFLNMSRKYRSKSKSIIVSMNSLIYALFSKRQKIFANMWKNCDNFFYSIIIRSWRSSVKNEKTLTNCNVWEKTTRSDIHSVEKVVGRHVKPRIRSAVIILYLLKKNYFAEGIRWFYQSDNSKETRWVQLRYLQHQSLSEQKPREDRFILVQRNTYRLLFPLTYRCDAIWLGSLAQSIIIKPSLGAQFQTRKFE